MPPHPRPLSQRERGDEVDPAIGAQALETDMNITSRLHSLFTDDRFDSNLIAVYGVIVTAIVLSLILRRKLGASSPSQLFHWPGLHWLNALTDHAHRHARRVLFWLTAGFIVFVAFAGVAYHAAGRDVRTDLGDWYTHLTISEL